MSLRFLVESHYGRVRADVNFWREHVEVIAKRHGLSMQTYEATMGEATNAVFFVGDAIVKIYTPYFHGRESKGIEPAALLSIAEDREIPVPRIRARGELFVRSRDWNWPYVVMSRASGRVLEADWEAMEPAGKRELMKHLGSLMARIHKVRPSTELATAFQQAWPRGFSEFIARQLEALKLHPERATLPISDDLDDLVLPQTTGTWPSVLHGDLEGAHLFHEGTKLTGIIDFGDAKLGDPAYDFVSVRNSLAASDLSLLEPLFEGYGSDPREAEGGIYKLGVYTVLHEWTKPKDISKWCARSGSRSVHELASWLWTQG